ALRAGDELGQHLLVRRIGFVIDLDSGLRGEAVDDRLRNVFRPREQVQLLAGSLGQLGRRSSLCRLDRGGVLVRSGRGLLVGRRVGFGGVARFGRNDKARGSARHEREHQRDSKNSGTFHDASSSLAACGVPWRRISSAVTASTTVSRMNSVEIAFRVGSRPFLTRPKISSGSVREPALAVKYVTISSSSDSENDISAPEMTAGMRYGTRTLRKAWTGVAPRSSAASSSAGSSPARRASTATSTNGKQNVTCEMMMLVKPSSR